MAFTDIDNPELYFQTKIYSGDGNDDRDIVFDVTDTTMQPNMLMSSRRDSGDNKSIYDSVRGDGKELRTAENAGEYDRSDNIQALNSNGFQVGADSQVNASGGTYVSWAWKAGGSASSNSDGGTSSSVSANTTSGFSIANWVGSSSDSVQTIGHGLGATPHWILSKNRGSGSSITAWINYQHKLDASAPEDYTIYLHNSDARVDNAVHGDTAPTSSVFSFNTGSDDQNYISYCFTEKQGFSKFGSYVGNGASNTNGQFIYLGFRPAMVLVKRTNGAKDWKIFDNKRNGYNGSNEVLEANNTDAEDTTEFLDFLSNGFKWRIPSSDGKYADVNGEDDTFIYMAFAEQPFVNSKGVPCNAR